VHNAVIVKIALDPNIALNAVDLDRVPIASIQSMVLFVLACRRVWTIARHELSVCRNTDHFAEMLERLDSSVDTELGTANGTNSRSNAGNALDNKRNIHFGPFAKRQR